MSNEELVARIERAIRECASFGVNPHKAAEEIIGCCLQEAQKKIQSGTIEDCVKIIKDIAKEKGFNADVTITYK